MLPRKRACKLSEIDDFISSRNIEWLFIGAGLLRWMFCRTSGRRGRGSFGEEGDDGGEDMEMEQQEGTTSPMLAPAAHHPNGRGKRSVVIHIKGPAPDLMDPGKGNEDGSFLNSFTLHIYAQKRCACMLHARCRMAAYVFSGSTLISKSSSFFSLLCCSSRAPNFSHHCQCQVHRHSTFCTMGTN